MNSDVGQQAEPQITYKIEISLEQMVLLGNEINVYVNSVNTGKAKLSSKSVFGCVIPLHQKL